VCDLGCDRWDLPDRFLILRDECVDITLSVRDFLQSQSNGADTRALGYFVRVDRASGTPADDLPLFGGGLQDRLRRQRNHALLQMLQSVRSESRRERLDQIIELAVTVASQRVKRFVCKFLRERFS
jgi:hypothetical protein